MGSDTELAFRKQEAVQWLCGGGVLACDSEMCTKEGGSWWKEGRGGGRWDEGFCLPFQ